MHVSLTPMPFLACIISISQGAALASEVPPAKVIPGMKLEAVDRKNPHLICVATVQQIDLSRGADAYLIHFDGWSDAYDYWASLDVSDLHPVGWCESTHAHLQKPKGYSKAEFAWSSYLQETNATAVPKQLLTHKTNARVAKTTLKSDGSRVGAGTTSVAHVMQLAFNVYNAHFKSVQGARDVVTELHRLGDELRAAALSHVDKTPAAPPVGTSSPFPLARTGVMLDVDTTASSSDVPFAGLEGDGMDGGVAGGVVEDHRGPSPTRIRSERLTSLEQLLRHLRSLLVNENLSAFEFRSTGLAHALLDFLTLDSEDAYKAGLSPAAIVHPEAEGDGAHIMPGSRDVGYLAAADLTARVSMFKRMFFSPHQSASEKKNPGQVRAVSILLRSDGTMSLCVHMKRLCDGLVCGSILLNRSVSVILVSGSATVVLCQFEGHFCVNSLQFQMVHFKMVFMKRRDVRTRRYS